MAVALGRFEAAAGSYANAAEPWREAGSVIGRVYALLGAGRCAGDPRVLAEGNEIFASLGAVPIAARRGSLTQQQT